MDKDALDLATELFSEAQRRYLNDAELHYTADMTARILRELRIDPKQPWPDDFEADRYIAALALLLVERDFHDLRSPRQGANGYVVVPRHLLDELLAAALGAGGTPDVFRRLVAARAAVVEAVGPTREDTKP